jgi:rare lipoprotein A
MILAGLMCGIATFYGVGDGFNGQRTASGKSFNAYGLTAAHPYLRMGSKLRITNQDNMKQVIVTVNDRGPYSHADIDLSYGAFRKIASPSNGNATVCFRVIA